MKRAFFSAIKRLLSLKRFLDKDSPKRFVIRLTKKRDVVHHGVRKNCHKMAKALPCEFKATLIKYEEGKEKVSKRFFGVPSFFNYAIADGLYNLLFPDKTGLKDQKRQYPGFSALLQLLVRFVETKSQETPVKKSLTFCRDLVRRIMDSHAGQIVRL